MRASIKFNEKPMQLQSTVMPWGKELDHKSNPVTEQELHRLIAKERQLKPVKS